MELKQLKTAEENNRWNDFVDGSPQGSLFSKTPYQEAIGLTYTIWVVEQNGEWIAGMLLGNRNGRWTFGPFQKYTGVLFAEMEGNYYTTETNRRAALRLLLVECNKLGSYDYFFHPEFGNWLLYYQAGYKETTYYTYRIAVKGITREELLGNCAPRLRTKIRKTYSDNSLVVEKNVDAAICYRLLHETFMRKKEKIVFNRKLFDTLCRALNEVGSLHFYRAVSKTGEITSVLGIAYDKHCAYLLFSAYSEAAKMGGDNERLIYEAVCDAAERVNCFDFEGSMLQGVESYYRQFGGQMTPYFRIYKPSIVGQVKEAVRNLL